MANSREKILRAVRQQISPHPPGRAHRSAPTMAAEVISRIQEHSRGTIPARVRVDHNGLIALFIKQAEKAGAEIIRENPQTDAMTCPLGIAETGTILFFSCEDTPTSSIFLAETHVVALSEKNIVASYEDAFDYTRTLASQPRSIHLITGPSRTGDIEQTILIGMHGPKKLRIFLIS